MKNCRAISRSIVEPHFNNFNSQNRFVNRFKNSEQLTRKNLLCLKFREYLLQFPNVHNFLPTTFIIPQEFQNFVESFSSHEIWILKPANKARGLGIFLINSLNDIPKKLQNGHQPQQEER